VREGLQKRAQGQDEARRWEKAQVKVIHHGGLGFIIIPKAGGSSIKTAIRDGMGLEPNGGIHADKRLPITNTTSGLHSVAFIRHPLDRLVSAWANKIHSKRYVDSHLAAYGFRLGMPFDEFVRHAAGHHTDSHMAPQVKFLAEPVDRIERFERMGEVWKDLQQRFEWLPDLPHANKTEHAPWSEMYTPETRAIAERIYSEDLALWHSLSA